MSAAPDSGPGSGDAPSILSGLSRHNRELLGGAATAFLLKAAGTGTGFLLSVVVARLLGAEGAGMYFLAVALGLVFATVGRLGVDNALVRHVAAARASDDPDGVRSFVRAAAVQVSAGSMVAAIGLFALAPRLAVSVFGDPSVVTPLRWVAGAVVPLAFVVVFAQALKGLERIRDSVLVLNVAQPVVVLGLVGLLVPIAGAGGAIIAYGLGAAAAAITGAALWMVSRPARTGATSGSGVRRKLLDSSVPLFGVDLMNLVIAWSALLLLGWWAPTEEAGLYGVAVRVATLASFALVAVNAIAAPKLSGFWARGDLVALRSSAVFSTRLATIAALPVLLPCLIAPDLVLSIFGSEFREGGSLLRLLAIGHSINAATGSVGFVLMMTGHERLFRGITAASAGLCLVAGLLLIPRWGGLGAAVATSLTLGTQNLLAALAVWSRFGFIMLPFAGSGRPSEKAPS